MITNEERKSLKRVSKNFGVIFASLGILLMAVYVIYGFAISFVFGAFFFVGGFLVAIHGPEWGEAYVVKQRQAESDRKRRDISEFVDDKTGIVWVWIVALTTWAIMAIAYFALSMVVYMILDSAEAFIPWGSAPAWADQYLSVIYLTRNVMAWFLIIMTVGIIGWALINSTRRGEDTYPAY